MAMYCPGAGCLPVYSGIFDLESVTLVGAVRGIRIFCLCLHRAGEANFFRVEALSEASKAEDVRSKWAKMSIYVTTVYPVEKTRPSFWSTTAKSMAGGLPSCLPVDTCKCRHIRSGAKSGFLSQCAVLIVPKNVEYLSFAEQ